MTNRDTGNLASLTLQSKEAEIGYDSFEHEQYNDPEHNIT